MCCPGHHPATRRAAPRRGRAGASPRTSPSRESREGFQDASSDARRRRVSASRPPLAILFIPRRSEGKLSSLSRARYRARGRHDPRAGALVVGHARERRELIAGCVSNGRRPRREPAAPAPRLRGGENVGRSRVHRWRAARGRRTGRPSRDGVLRGEPEGDDGDQRARGTPQTGPRGAAPRGRRTPGGVVRRHAQSRGRSLGGARAGNEGRRRGEKGMRRVHPRVHARGCRRTRPTRRHARLEHPRRDARSNGKVPYVRRTPGNRRGRGHRGISRAGAAGGDAVARQDKRRGSGAGTGTKSRHPARLADRLADAERRHGRPVRADDGLRAPRAVAGRLREREPSRLRVRRGRDVRGADPGVLPARGRDGSRQRRSPREARR